MPLWIALLFLAACAASSTPSTSGPRPTLSDSTMTLFSFDSDSEPTWFVDNDGIMGGHSQGFIGLDGGTLSFTGTLVTEDGGFTSARVEHGVDLSAYEGVELRVRGGGRTFEVEVNDATRNREREVSRRAPFPTTDDWQTVRIPFADLDATAFGEPAEVGPLDRAGVESFGLFIADGIDGAFQLEVDWIRAYAG